MAAGVTCSTDGFCWHGQTYGGTFHGVSGTSSSFVMAVGEGGVYATWNGSVWTYAQSPTSATLRGVWFSSPTEGWAVGDRGTLLQWNGTVFTSLVSGTTRDLLAIHGNGAVVYAGGNEIVLRRQSGSWSPVPGALPVTDSNSIVRSIAVVSANEVYLAGIGSGGFFKTFDGAAWRDMNPMRTGGPTESDALYSVASCGTSLFASGNYSGEFHASWARRSGVWSEFFAQGARLVCLTDSEFLSFGASYYGNTTVQLVSPNQMMGLQSVGTGLNVNAAFAAGPREVFLVGAGGLLTRWTGPTLGARPERSTTNVFAFAANNVWRLVSTDVVERLDGNTWQPVAVPGAGSVVDVFSPAVGEAWVLRQNPNMRQNVVAHHLVNGSWSRHEDFPAGTRFVRGSSANDVWFSGGAGAVSKWTGTELLTYFVPTQAGTGPMHVTATQVWVPTSGMSGPEATYRRVNGAWQAVPTVNAWRISGAGDEVYFTAVASLMRWSGGRVAEVAMGIGSDLVASSSTAVFVAGVTYESDGPRSSLKKVGLTDGRVSELDVGTNEALTAISATLDGHVWLSTAGGGLLHFAP